MEAERVIAGLAYNLKWKTVAGKDYLYEIIDRVGHAKVLARSPENEAVFAHYRTTKASAIVRRDESRMSLDETYRLYRALRLPLIPFGGRTAFT